MRCVLMRSPLLPPYSSTNRKQDATFQSSLSTEESLDDHLDECCADVGVFGFTDDLSLPGELDADWGLAFLVAESALSTRNPKQFTNFGALPLVAADPE